MRDVLRFRIQQNETYLSFHLKNADTLYFQMFWQSNREFKFKFSDLKG